MIKLLVLACLIPSAAMAVESNKCTDIAIPRDAVAAHGGKWIELTHDQWQFLRGIFVLNPLTPAGLPFGDKAVLAQVPEENGGVVFFIDGLRACTPMAAPHELVDMLHLVGGGEIAHEGDGL